MARKDRFWGSIPPLGWGWAGELSCGGVASASSPSNGDKRRALSGKKWVTSVGLDCSGEPGDSGFSGTLIQITPSHSLPSGPRPWPWWQQTCLHWEFILLWSLAILTRKPWSWSPVSLPSHRRDERLSTTKEAVVVLRYVHKSFDTPLFKRWRLIPLSFSVGET